MSEKSHLLKKLAEIEAEEKQLINSLEVAKSKLEGKAFSNIYTKGKTKNANYTYYWGFSIESGQLECEVRNVSVYFNPMSARWNESGITRKRNYETFYNFNSQYCDILTRFTEISLDEFEKYWNYVGEKARISIEVFFSENVPVVVEYEKERNAELDLPYWSIPINLLHYVEGSIFYVGKNRLLKSPKSKEYVLSVIEDYQERDNRCAHLYGECDRRYVENTRKNLSDLEQLIQT